MGANQSSSQPSSSNRSPQPQSTPRSPSRSPPYSSAYANYYQPSRTVVGPLPPGYPTAPYPTAANPQAPTYPYSQYYPQYFNPWGGYPSAAWGPYQAPPGAAPWGGAFQWPGAAAAPAPPILEEVQETERVRNTVNVHRNSLRLVEDPADPRRRLLTFTLDAEVEGSLSIFFVAREGPGCSFTELHPSAHSPTFLPFPKGTAQKFSAPPGSGVDLSRLPPAQLASANEAEGRFPLVIRTHAGAAGPGATGSSSGGNGSSSSSGGSSSSLGGSGSGSGTSSGTNQAPAAGSPPGQGRAAAVLAAPGAPLSRSVQSQMTYAVLERQGDGKEGAGAQGFSVRVLKQKLWVEGVTYELKEMYGMEQCGRGGTGKADGSSAAGGEGEGAGGGGKAADVDDDEEDEVEGTECVICLSAPRTTTVLPCNHMCMCGDCAKVLRFQTSRCPICRQTVERLLEIRVRPRGGTGWQGAQQAQQQGAPPAPAAAAAAESSMVHEAPAASASAGGAAAGGAAPLSAGAGPLVGLTPPPSAAASAAPNLMDAPGPSVSAAASGSSTAAPLGRVGSPQPQQQQEPCAMTAPPEASQAPGSLQSFLFGS